MAKGTVKWFNSKKGYGFIEPENGGDDVFVHMTAVRNAGLTFLKDGQKLSYEIAKEKGKTTAVDLVTED